MGKGLKKQTIVISAINFFEGGPLSVLKDNLKFANDVLSNDFKIIALVHKKELFILDDFKNIHIIEFPKSKGNYSVRLYLEYFHFKRLSKKWNPHLWFSLHDITPNVKAKIRAVYCHNPTPFKKVKISDLFFQPTIFLFSLFYKILYKINLKKNKYVVLQQTWLKKEFVKMFRLSEQKVLVCHPVRLVSGNIPIASDFDKKGRPTTFFYPALARPFKNFEVIGKAVKFLEENHIGDFQVIITIKGDENNYAKYIHRKYSNLINLHFTGMLTPKEVEEIYVKTDALLFPSTLETWGLPITEFKGHNKPIILSNLPYAYETIGKYDKACFFDPYDAKDLSNKMISFINGNLNFDVTSNIKDEVLSGWADLYSKILRE